MKTRRAAVVALKPALSMTRMSKLLTSSEVASHDIASEAQRWSLSLCTVQEDFIRFDMEASFLMLEIYSRCPILLLLNVLRTSLMYFSSGGLLILQLFKTGSVS